MNALSERQFDEWIGRQSFLVVEDVASSRLLVSGTLRSMGAKEVVAAADGEDALAKLVETQVTPTVVLCDWSMPNMDGMELLAEIRKGMPSAKFVMLTGKAQVDDILTARNKGVDGYIVKPFKRENLVKALTRLISP